MPNIKYLLVGKSIQDKWKHLRDAFSLSLKKRSGDKQTKKYLYADNLQFLLKIFQKDVTESSISDHAQSPESDDETSSTISSAPGPSQAMAGSSVSRPRKRQKPVAMDETDKAIIAALEASSKPSAEIDEDMAFFTSVTPSLKNFSEDEKLDFRMGVLNLIKNIKANRNRLPVAQNVPCQMNWSVPPNTSYPNNLPNVGPQNTNPYQQKQYEQL